MNTPVVIRHIHPHEGAALRDIRLRAIRDTPDAFAVSLADTLAHTDEGWAAWATGNAVGDTSIMFVAEDAGTWVGMAGSMRDPSGPEDVGRAGLSRAGATPATGRADRRLGERPRRATTGVMGHRA